MAEIKLGNLPVIQTDAPLDTQLPVNCMLWGKSGSGKTSLASSAPGRKLFIQFDNAGHISLIGRDDCLVIDLSSHDHSITQDFTGDNPLRLREFILAHEIKTVVFDSLTTYNWMLLLNVVAKLKGRNNISLESPSQAGYAQRNIGMQRTLTSILGLTSRMNIGTILILHENTPTMKQVLMPDGKTAEVPGDITPSITMRMVDTIGVRMSEIWHLTQLDNGARRVEVRPVRGYTPMKTRMFNGGVGTNGEFIVKYDAATNTGDGIATWIDMWRKGGGRKLALPRV